MKPTPKRKLRVQFFVGEDKQFYFRIVAGNGEPIAISEGYTSYNKAVKTGALLRDNMHEASFEGEG